MFLFHLAKFQNVKIVTGNPKRRRSMGKKDINDENYCLKPGDENFHKERDENTHKINDLKVKLTLVAENGV